MKRLLTAFALIAFAIYLIFFAPDPVFMAGALWMGLLCYYEFSALVARYGIQKPGVFGILLGLLILFQAQYTLLGVAILLVIALALSLRRDDLRGILPQVACAFLG